MNVCRKPYRQSQEMNDKPCRTRKDCQESTPAAKSPQDPTAEAVVITIRKADPLVGAGEHSTQDDHTAFYTTLQLHTPSGTNSMKVKIDPGAQANTIPLSKFIRCFPAY